MRGIIFVILFGAMAIISCSSDNNNYSAEPFIGTWKGKGSSFAGMELTPLKFVKFRSNGRTEFISKGSENQNISHYGDWTKNDDTLTITWDEGNSSVLQILELTPNSLKWKDDSYGGTITGTRYDSFER
jgi:hypothetical protein